MKRILLLTTLGILFSALSITAQDVMSPLDPVITYDGTADPGTLTNPLVPSNGIISKWIRTKHPRVTWNTDAYKSYYWNGMAYRLRFPKNYLAQPGKKWPIIVFYHGGGEIGPIRDNEFHLLWGAQQFGNDADNGKFDCFILYPQETAVGWDDSYFSRVNSVLDTLFKYNRVDEDKVITMGLSAGGLGSVSHAVNYPERVAKIISSSPSYINTLVNDIPAFIHIPLWISNGGRDPRPDTFAIQQFITPYYAAGGNLRRNYYPTLDHNTWTAQWAEPAFIPELNSAHKANPLVYFGRKDFCPDSAIVAHLGLTPGFFAYEWEKDGVTIGGASSHEYFPTAFGTYRCRFKRTASSNWSEWSPSPVVIAVKTATQTPPIIVSGIRSKVLPALDGSTTVPLELAAGYTGYSWKRTSDNTELSQNRIYEASVGQYYGNVKEQFGCSSLPSPNFTVVNANGVQKPDKAKNLSAFAIDGGSVQLDWNKNATSLYPATNFEIYRATQPGGPYVIAGITDANTLSFTDAGLENNTDYYYVVRAVNDNAAAEKSNEAVVKTQIDNIAPTAPSNLKVVFQTREFVELSWDASTDNTAVDKYDVYVNGEKSYTYNASNVTCRVYNLPIKQTFNFTIKARDKSGNTSNASNQVTGSTYYSGLRYRYYEGSYDVLPNFNLLTPLEIGTTTTFNVSPRKVSDFYAFVWEGHVIIPEGQGGTYTFRTTSDDGSKLYINTLFDQNATPIVNNDGLHGNVTVTSAGIALTGGKQYLLTGTYFEKNGGELMRVEYRGPATGNAWVEMPAIAFSEPITPPGAAPIAPAYLKATATAYNKISLNWEDNSSDETGFEIVRATSVNGTFLPIFTTAANATSYIDSGLNAQTTYFYKIRSIGIDNSSPFVANVTEANWRLNGNLNEQGGNTARNLTGIGTIAYDNVLKQEGASSLTFNGTNTAASVNNSTSGGFPSNAYAERTVALWVRPGSVTTKQMIFDFGGNANGLALRINATGTVSAGIASNNVRAIVTSPAPLTLNTWAHIAVVYKANSLKLYVNGTEVAANNSLSFSAIAAISGSSSRFGNPNTTAVADNAFNDASYSFYNGKMDNIYIIGNATLPSEIQGLQNDSFLPSSARTLDAPLSPNAPTVLTQQVISTRQINLNWTDNSNNETGFEIYRSTNTNSNYRLLATTAPNTNTYQDTSCFANVTYYYKVRAIAGISVSAYSNEVFGKTQNTKPVINDIADFTMKYGTSLIIPIVATDADNDDMSFTYKNLPRFVSFTNTGNGTGNLSLNPFDIHQGTYKFRFIVSDPNTGKDTMEFILVVNNNSLPVINAINNVSLNEGSSSSVNLVATDAENTANIKWKLVNLPPFASFVNNGNGNGTITLTPGFASSGVYLVTVVADDGFGAWASKDFSITVNEKSPNVGWLVNVKYQTTAPTPWNNWEPANGNTALNNLKNTNNQTTTVGVSLTPNYSFDKYEFGVNTGNNSGYYPDAVLRDNFYLQGNLDTMTIQVSGLNPSLLYNFRFMSATTNSNETANSRTGFRIGSRRDSVVVKNNTQKTAYIAGITPDAGGNVAVKMFRTNGANTAYLNAMEIEANFNDGTIPVTPTQLSGEFVKGVGNKLYWKDIAYNEISYLVYRSTAKTGPYTLLNPGAVNLNDTTFTDGNVVVSTSYFYYLIASNNIGNALPSDTINITTGNNPPVLNNLKDIYVKAGTAAQLNFSASDDPGDIVTISTTQLPSFAQLNTVGNNYTIDLNPNRDHIGWYYATVTISDDKGASTAQNFRIIVSDNQTKTVLVKFAGDGGGIGKPWNNLSFAYPYNGLNVQNMSDDNGQPTTFDLTLTSDFFAFFKGGFNTGNNAGIISDSALYSGLIEGQSNVRTFRISGLDPLKLYSLGFVSSINAGHPATTTFAVGGNTITTDARYNTDLQGRLNGLAPNASGEIVVSMSKPITNNWYGYLNAMMIDEYDPALTPIVSPAYLKAEPTGRKSVKLTWADRSSNETGGFEIYRATTSAGIYSLIETTVQNSTAFIDTTGTEGTRYFYKVRAKGAAAQFSDYSNIAETITSTGLVYINFKTTLPGGGLWNNTGKLPVAGDVYSNLKNDQSYLTGYHLNLLSNLGGSANGNVANPANSGVFPDSVLFSNFGIAKDQIVSFKIIGLNQSKRYRIGFAGSSDVYGNFNTTMSIGNRTVYLGAMFNTTKAVYIGDVVPDNNGDVMVHFSTHDDAAVQSGLIGALVIQAYGDDEDGGTLLNIAPPVNEAETTLLRTGGNEQTINIGAFMQIKAYPNPFNKSITLDVHTDQAIQNVVVQLYDLNGKLVYNNINNALHAGSNLLQLDLSKQSLPAGTYLIKMLANNKSMGTLKLVKASQ